MTTLRIRGRIATAALALCAAGTAFGGLVAGLGVPAAATDVAAPAPSEKQEIGVGVSRLPSFLKTSQLPQGSRYGKWKASGVYTGTPRNPKFCLGHDVLPAAETRYRTYRGKKNVAAEEFVTIADNEAAAAALVSKLRTQIQGCYSEWLDADIPQYREGKRSASWKRYNTYAVEDGMTVIGVFTVPPKGFVKTTHLYAVGRDGAMVVVLHLGVPGGKAKAPAAKFTTAGATALRQAL
ncbi:hypothetical protein GCM10009547_26540 [Sporichthya brevicatena]|uniref:Uncharacterized protein n=1 Tax=Sporichthya brevicatena TaxID=171442 RepID=A0ABN1GX34_9ACTN